MHTKMLFSPQNTIKARVTQKQKPFFRIIFIKTISAFVPYAPISQSLTAIR